MAGRTPALSWQDATTKQNQGRSFQYEYRELLLKNGIPLDDQYMWD